MVVAFCSATMTCVILAQFQTASFPLNQFMAHPGWEILTGNYSYLDKAKCIYREINVFPVQTGSTKVLCDRPSTGLEEVQLLLTGKTHLRRYLKENTHQWAWSVSAGKIKEGFSLKTNPTSIKGTH